MSLEAFFSPQSVAIVGASRSRGRVGREILEHVVRGGYEGAVYPINPKANEIAGLRCYAGLKSIGAAPDLAVIAVGSGLVPDVMRDCAAVGVKAAIVITSGFAESGREGEELERSVVEIARRARMRVLGPNCLGLVSVAEKLNAGFAGEMPPLGGIGYFSQSGSLLAAILDMASSKEIGFSKLVSMGNKADVNELDIMRAFGRDPETSVVAGYLESISDADAFAREAERISRQKPILLIKSGETCAGAAAATSHTGGRAATEPSCERVPVRGGIVCCDSITTQFDLAQAFATQPLPSGPRVAVLGNGGGLGIMAVDAIEREGLTLAAFAEGTRRELDVGLPAAAHKANPTDLRGDAPADRFELALRAILADPNVDSVLLLVSPHALTECTLTAQAAVRVSSEMPDKPILACFLGARKVAEAIAVLQKGRIPQYGSPESAVHAIKAMTDYACARAARPRGGQS